jgi:hypothetical protein
MWAAGLNLPKVVSLTRSLITAWRDDCWDGLYSFLDKPKDGDVLCVLVCACACVGVQGWVAYHCADTVVHSSFCTPPHTSALALSSSSDPQRTGTVGWLVCATRRQNVSRSLCCTLSTQPRRCPRACACIANGDSHPSVEWRPGAPRPRVLCCRRQTRCANLACARVRKKRYSQFTRPFAVLGLEPTATFREVKSACVRRTEMMAGQSGFLVCE